eukprot:NODE_418_length_965_cov_754.903930_g324_i0.p1 GENE.NODE_418_length_965_cov_754.903930_g324_i0~~NODE_418_length_965_cov_754.903930_g324_i0.p1  ORF type:complete len:213 (-),score=56.66 NODE_418_length_965_cov_754.903930_g324_i0:325-939(-)
MGLGRERARAQNLQQRLLAAIRDRGGVEAKLAAQERSMEDLQAQLRKLERDNASLESRHRLSHVIGDARGVLLVETHPEGESAPQSSASSVGSGTGPSGPPSRASSEECESQGGCTSERRMWEQRVLELVAEKEALSAGLDEVKVQLGTEKAERQSAEDRIHLLQQQASALNVTLKKEQCTTLQLRSRMECSTPRTSLEWNRGE